MHEALLVRSVQTTARKNFLRCECCTNILTKHPFQVKLCIADFQEVRKGAESDTG
jgi:hypothetical protein